MISIRELSSADAFEQLKDRWQQLVRESPSATPFQTWEWQSTWWEHYGGRKKLRILQAFEGSELVGLYPLMRSGGVWRSLRPVGIGASDYLHPLVREGYEEVVAEAIGKSLRSIAGIDLLDLHQIRETQPIAQLDPGFSHATCLVLSLPKTYDEYLAMLGKSLRYDVKRLDKKYFASGDAVIRTVDANSVGVGLEILFEQHRLRWKEKHLPGAFLGKSIAFHHAWAPKALEAGMLRLSILEWQGRPIGAIYAMALHGRTYYYQAGFDPAHSALSPGTLLVAHTLKQAITEGCTEFDFMRGDEPYKRRWKPQSTYANVRILLPKSAIMGRIGEKWNRFGSRIESKVRAKLEGNSGGVAKPEEGLKAENGN